MNMIKKKKMVCSLVACALAMGGLTNAYAVDINSQDMTTEVMTVMAQTKKEADERIQIFPIYLGQGYCTGNGVRVRKGQGTNYAILGSLYKGDLINVYNVEHEVEGWTYITHGCDEHPEGLAGYMASKYVSDLDPARLESETQLDQNQDDEIVFEVG